MFLKYCLYKTTVSQQLCMLGQINLKSKDGSNSVAGKRKLGGSRSACDQPEVMKGNLHATPSTLSLASVK